MQETRKIECHCVDVLEVGRHTFTCDQIVFLVHHLRSIALKLSLPTEKVNACLSVALVQWMHAHYKQHRKGFW